MSANEQQQKEKIQICEHIHNAQQICWEKCIGKPSTDLYHASEKCVYDCLERFIETSLLVTERMAEIVDCGFDID